MMKNNRSIPPQHKGSTTSEARNDVHSCKEDKAAVRSHVVENKATHNKLASKPSPDIDASAEAFIKKFRTQLMIQRLESIENYEQMLARGL
ncbi:unnamed protein product [Dovyalis caffra]|uniref:Uncharacterized protein n=1 Tax=Dovyalis caffra TaxID=77055 RepID=A0AAV1SRA6_9ROSI|nr:unnamed protein product [Dovyalis caffra]